MKRNKNLIELSRDHHHGLLLGWKIKEGFKRNIPVGTIAAYITFFADKALFPHFEEEETQVLTFLNENDELRRRTIEEHIEIRDLVQRISSPGFSDKETLIRLARRMEAHIRFEERELFPYIETSLPESELDEIGELIAKQHYVYVESYPNEFWTN